MTAPASPHDTPRAAWTDERVAELRRLWAEGMEARQIAEALGGGATKNSVLGKAHRLRLPGRDEGATKPAKPAPAPRADKSINAKRSAPIRKRTSVPPPSPPVEVTFMVPLIELTESMCKYPAGDGADIRFCGAPKARGSWCAHHAGIVYVPLHRRPEGVDYRVKRGDGQTAIRWRHGRGVTRYAAE